jgi:uncharacterized protein YukE
MSTHYGANPDELDHLGLTLTRQIDTIGAVLTDVSAVLLGTTWVGPARDRFETEWNGSFRNALTRLNEAFAAAGQDCTRRSEDLRQVMGGV